MDNKRIDFGSRWVYIPMLAIVASMFLRLIVSFNMETLASACFGLLLFGVYLAARTHGDKALWVFPYATAIEAISVIVQGILVPGEYAGGIITSPITTTHTVNYDIATGFLVFGWLLSDKWRAWLTPLVLVALFFTGASEAVFLVAALGIVILIRRDWNKVMLISIAITLIVAGIWFSLGHGNRLYSWAFSTVETALTQGRIHQDGTTYESPLWGRVRVIQESFQRLKPLGNGYTVVSFNLDTVHNVPLIIVDQLGIIAGLAWSIATIYCLIKTKWRYAWIGVIAMSVFDHFIWTQMSPFWWLLVGVSTKEIIKHDYIFKSDSGDTLLQRSEIH